MSRSSPPNNESIRLRIEGMTGGGCVTRVERALRALAGVEDVYVNLAAETARIDTKAAAPSWEQLANAVRRAGYDVETFRKGNPLHSGLERTSEARIREQRQAVAQAIGIGLPVVVLHLLAPVLLSKDSGGKVWPLGIQALLCAILISSSAGAPILVGGLRALLRGIGSSDLLVTLGTGTAFVAGTICLVGSQGNASHFQSAAIIIAAINLGRLVELHARRAVCRDASTLARLLPHSARLAANGESESVPIGRVAIADHIRIDLNTIVPVDGRVIEGEGMLDESALTGETQPHLQTVGDDILAGTLLTEGALTIEATRVQRDSAIGRIIQDVERAQADKSRLHRTIDRVTGALVPLVILTAVATLFGSHFAASLDWSAAATRAVAVLIIASPAAIGLAAPAVAHVAVSTAAMQGILLRGISSLEKAGQGHLRTIDSRTDLMNADIGITFTSPSDAASCGSDITVIHGDPRRLEAVVALARHSKHLIRQNLVVALAYNILAVPLAAAGKISPGCAAAAMMGCSICIVLNALRLRTDMPRSNATRQPDPASETHET